MGGADVRKAFIEQCKAVVADLKAGLPALDPELSEIREVQIQVLEAMIQDLVELPQ